MDEYLTTANAAHGTAAAEPEAPLDKCVTDPREVAALVLAQTSVVHAKKDELTSAIRVLADMGQELARAYVGQVQTTQELTRRVKALEATATGPIAPPRDDEPTGLGFGPRGRASGA
jgi:hypothetical protein